MNNNERLKVKSMGGGEVFRLLDSMCWQKVHQGDAVRVAPANNYVSSMLDLLLSDADLIRHRDDQGYVRRRIEQTMEAHPLDRSLIEKNSVKQILKLICSCIYKKVDEDDADGKEKAYKSFQILAKYLEGKGITGIIYPCTRTNRIKGKNVVLFDIHDAVPIIGSITQYHYNGAV